MGRILAIDYGKKRTGLAVTDPEQIIATGLTTVDTDKLGGVLKQYFAKEPVELILLGHPKKLDGTDNDITPKVEKFFGQLSRLFPQIPAKLLDERFTSAMAFQTMIDSGLKKKDRRDKALVDEISATILLQGYLQGR
jgi:putative Holliday junction resolvase